MNQEEMEALLRQEVKGLSSYLVNEDYTNSCNDASRELGWSFPVSTDFRIHWMKQRAKRFLIFYLISESAFKFKFKQINLQNRFAQLERLLKLLDTEFSDIQNERPDEFANVQSFEMFGHSATAGFAYEPQTGIDITHSSDQIVEIKPDENS